MADATLVFFVDDQVARYPLARVFVEFEEGCQSILDVCHSFAESPPLRSVGWVGWTVVAAHARSGRVDYRHGVAVVVVRVRLLVLLAEQSVGIVLIEAFDAECVAV